VPVARIDWEDLPASTRQAIEKHTGPVLQAMTVSEGLNSAVAAVLTNETGQFFAKGLRADYPRRWTQDMDALIDPYVTTLAPRLLWRVQDEGDMLGFELIKGRHADWNPLTVLITSGRGYLIDWAWPTRGAGWIDPACLIIRLIAAGHTPQSAEDTVRAFPAWQAAPSE